MEQTKLKIEILPNLFLKEDGTFDKEKALMLCGKIAGVCYDKEGFHHLETESEEKTRKRINLTLNNGHHSVYDHIPVSLNLQNIPKILAMVLNNEHQYTTSEKSARYTPLEKQEGSIITDDEVRLYHKWLEIFRIKIKAAYGTVYNDSKIQKLAQENARYLVTVFMPTQMIYSTSLRQINYLASWMQEYATNIDGKKASNFEKKLAKSMKEFCNMLATLNLLEPALMENEKSRKLSLFGKDLKQKQSYFGDTYITVYKGSIAQLAQAQRHRTLDYQMEFLQSKEYFIPPIIADDNALIDEWLTDIKQLKHVTPQGEIILISESGKYEDFILKGKERLCSGAQLEIRNQTKKTLLEYQDALETSNHPLAQDIKKYCHGARCTFPDFVCSSDCNFSEGKTLISNI